MYIRSLTAALAASAIFATSAIADIAPFSGGWTLDQTVSSLNFVSIKKGAVMELSRFATLEGTIAEDGSAALTIPLDSVDTSVDLRNVRMRFLFFETFAKPTATVSTKLTPALLADLETAGTISTTLPFTLSLNGAQKQLEAEVLVTLIGPNRVSVSSIAPVLLKVEDFGLMAGLRKLEEAAEVTIVPATSVTFNFAFDRAGAGVATDLPAPAPLAVAARVSPSKPPALEPSGVLDREACLGRFEIISRSENIQFTASRATLTSSSRTLLDEVAEIVSKCPGMVIQVGGHTDSRGSTAYNLSLSERRAAAVVRYLTRSGLPAARFEARGFGEAQPIAPNTTQLGRQKNRRIEFKVIGFAEAKLAE